MASGIFVVIGFLIVLSLCALAVDRIKRKRRKKQAASDRSRREEHGLYYCWMCGIEFPQSNATYCKTNDEERYNCPRCGTIVKRVPLHNPIVRSSHITVVGSRKRCKPSDKGLSLESRRVIVEMMQKQLDVSDPLKQRKFSDEELSPESYEMIIKMIKILTIILRFFISAIPLSSLMRKLYGVFSEYLNYYFRF